MPKFGLPFLLFFFLAGAHAANPRRPCANLTPIKDQSRWQWMDGNCNMRTRADLKQVLANHLLWARKYSAYLDNNQALDAHGAFRDPLRADFSGAQLEYADLSGAYLVQADLSGALLERADLTSAYLVYADLTAAHLDYAALTNATLFNANLVRAQLTNADLTRAYLSNADLTDANLDNADLTGADLGNADLTRAFLQGAEMTGVYLMYANLTDALLFGTDLTNTGLPQADLSGTNLANADLTGANLYEADLSSADFEGVNFTGAILREADLSSSKIVDTDLSDADLTGAKLWYADFEPKALPPVNGIARAEGLETLRWTDSFDELGYRTLVEAGPKANSPTTIPQPTLAQRWLLWLSWRREEFMGRTHGWRDGVAFLWSDLFFGLQPRPVNGSTSFPKGAVPAPVNRAQAAKSLTGTKAPAIEQNEFPIVDLRNALQRAGYSEAEMQVNLAYQRHTQSWIGMVVYDWTCAYGLAPLRPLILALILAFLAVPLYWLGFRHRWFGSQILLVEKQSDKEVETPLGDPGTRPVWRAELSNESVSSPEEPEKLSERLRLRLVAGWRHSKRLIVASWPRLRWEAGFLKAIVLFSLISIVNLGFEGLDFGRWVRSLTFREYDLKARGWLRSISGAQSLIGLGLVALSLLSFFGHRFE
jgi:uncharacterized protein YjbI with pentapeptide repeats